MAVSFIPKSVHIVAINVFLLADIVFTSRLSRVFGDALAQPILLGTIAGISLMYTAAAFAEGRLTAVCLYIGTVGLLIGQLYVFSSITHAPVNFNSIFQHISITTFTVYFMISKAGLRSYLLRRITIFATAYCAFYSAIAVANLAGVLPPALFEAIVSSDIERGDRLFLYAGASAFAWFYWLSRTREMVSLANVAFLAICGAAIGLSLSRVFIGFVLSTSILFLLRVPNRMIGSISLGALGIASAVLLYGFVDPAWNPFSLFAGDTSGLVRGLEYETIRYLLWMNPVTGIGIAPNQTDIASLTGNFYFAASDLGALGPWWDMGLYGMILFFVGSYIATRPQGRSQGPFAEPLFLTGCMLVGYGCIAPALIMPGGSTYFALILGLWLDQRPVPRAAASVGAPSFRAALENPPGKIARLRSRHDLFQS